MSSVLSNASVALMKRERVSLVAATGLFFEHLKETSPDITLEKSLISYKGGIWGEESVEGVGFPILRSSNMRGKRIDVSGAAWCNVSEEQARSFILESGDILVTKSSGSVDLVGKAALFNDPNDGNTYLFSNFTMRLRPDRKTVIPEYLAWFLRSPQAFSWRFEKQQTSVGLRNLQSKEYLSQVIPIPDLEIQQWIIDYLNALENGDLKLNDLELPTTLSEQRRIVARIESLAARVNEAQRLREEAIVLSKVLQSRAFDGLLAERKFDYLPLKDILGAPLQNGLSIPASGIGQEGILFAKVGMVNTGKMNPRETKRVNIELSKESTFWMKQGDIFVSRGNSLELVGRAAVYNGIPNDCAFPDLLIWIRVDNTKIDPQYIVYFFQTIEARKYIESQASGTSPSMKKVSQPKLEGMPIPVPPLDEQRRIVAYLDSLQAKVDELRRLQSESERELSALMPSILDKAFKGEL